MDKIARASEIDQLAINTIRFLSIDAVQKANSGHPGAPMGMAPAIYVLWDRFLKHNPKNPEWFNRDRFILSAGHASMLLYSMLYMTGYDISLDDIRNFRQWGSRTPGHPEYNLSCGIEVTTGPLGQGFANGVGMAVAEKFLAAKFNRPGFDVIDHYIYAMVSDGDLQEGISYEAASFAGHHALGNLIYLYDDNSIQIEGSTSLVFSDDVRKRFEAVNWHVIGPINGNDLTEVEHALREGKEIKNKPTLIICKTNIAYGSPGKQDTASAHGEPLGVEEVVATKKKLGWPLEPDFHVPEKARSHMLESIPRGEKVEQEWNEMFHEYSRKYPEEHAHMIDFIEGRISEGWDEGLDELFDNLESDIPTRGASGKVLNSIAARVENLMGGSADLGPSNKTLLNGESDFSRDNYSGRNLRFGVREHSMTAMANGMALHGGIIPYTGTFLIFSEYMRPAIRLAAMMGLQVIFVFSHDSIGLGEDGPTHQPIEQLTSLRAIPNLTVIRPADPYETMYAWKAAIMNRRGPTAIVTTRQKVPTLRDNHEAARGGYIVWQNSANPQGIIIATGSEVHISIAAAEKLKSEGIDVRVVSLPSCEIFDDQPQDYRDLVLPPDMNKRLAVEAGASLGWWKYISLEGAVLGIDRFGESAPSKILFERFGFTADNIVVNMKKLLSRS
ncbi:MAG TPA: transketolase [candidate division Zixibacteria bacterium]|nr:transketolase [candidate division Zixibacteria bacterium]HEQ98778.1 transketolase [candidate division Zixibacteria bacterium]